MAGSREEGFDVSTEASKLWDFLTYLSENDPEEYKKVISKELKEGKEMLTPPEPSFCLQSDIVPMYNCTTLYVNVSGWFRVPRPDTDEQPVPVKGGVLRYKMDTKTQKKTGGLIYDVSFNPSVLQECMDSTELEQMLIQLCFQYVEDMTKLRFVDKNSYKKLKERFVGPQNEIQYSIDENWKERLPHDCKVDFSDSILKEISKLKMDKKETTDRDLPELKLRPDKTCPVPHSKLSQPNKLIQEIRTQNEASFSTSAHGGERSVCTPKHSVCVNEASGSQGRTVCVCVHLPGVSSIAGIELDVFKDTLSLTVKNRFELTVHLPELIDKTVTRARFKSKTETLTISMPCVS